MRDLALARLEGEKERGGEVQVRCSGDIQPEQFLRNNFASIVSITIMMFRRGCERD